MNEAVTDRLYQLLPAIYRLRDAEHGQGLRALMRVLETELVALEQDVEGLYDNWFIETCDEWVVPYIGDLLKVPGLHTGGVGSFSLRAYVANVLAYRRRKGTATVLEQMASDVSGWRARAVEFGRLLAASQSLNHVRRAHATYTSVRDADALALLNGAFDNAAHSIDVRHADSGRGRHNIPNIGIFLWRLQSYELERVTPCAHAAPGHGRYTFNPIGLSLPLFNNPQPETEITHLAEEVNVPAALRRRPLYRELEARRAAIAAGASPRPVYFGTQPPFEVFLNGAALPIAPEALRICDLGGWDESGWQPPAQNAENIAACVDPQLGRLVVTAEAVERVEVSHSYGFSADVGGGSYNRNDSLVGLLGDATTIWWRGVSARTGNATGPVYATFGQAVKAWREWNRDKKNKIGVISVLDSDTYNEQLTGADHRIDTYATNRLILIAARWRSGELPGVGGSELHPDTVPVLDGDLSQLLVVEGVRPCLRGDISIKATPAAGVSGSAVMHVNGLLIEGHVTVLIGDLGRLEIAHCTIVPGRGGVTVNTSAVSDSDNAYLTLSLARSICGRLLLPEEIGGLHVTDSIIDGVDVHGQVRHAIAASTDGAQAGPVTRIERSTLRGPVHVKTLLLASDTIFTGAAQATRLQEGCVRYCSLPEGSRVPRRFRCQPDLALQAAREHVRNGRPATLADLPLSEYQRIVQHLHPMFTSLDYGDPGYAQLAFAAAAELRAGAEDGSEMGVFSHLRQPQREANIRANLAEYLRFGLEAGIFYVN